METKSPVSFLAHVARLPQKGMPVVIEADEKERAALAAAHDLLEVKNYRAELLVAPWKRHGVKVSGNVKADVVQECVVTLDPIENHIEEEIEGVFLPEDSKLGRKGFPDHGGEIVLDAEGPDSPETFTGDTIDLGAFAEEFFGLGIDPYPRKAGAVVEAENEPEIEEGPLQEKLRQLKLKS
ncbi:YceD family protein [Mesorhizobium sp. 1B3]|uniref:YceD family protein n=1 Tax=Mesorhizobium sp. 1B3 TaxID=3243599 RepID=UPI003D9540DC